MQCTKVITWELNRYRWQTTDDRRRRRQHTLNLTGRHCIGGKKGGAILRAHQKKILAIFLKSPMLEKPISFLRKLVSFQKCIRKTGPTDWKYFWKCFGNSNTFESVLPKLNTFEIYLLALFTQNTFVFCHTPNNCYHICTMCTLLLCK